MTGEMKKCTKCGEIKPLSDFVKNKRLNSGLGGKCKICHQKACESYARKIGKIPWIEHARPRKEITGVIFRHCGTCGKFYPLNHYKKSITSQDGLGPKCRNCFTSEYRSRYQTDLLFKEKAKKSSRVVGKKERVCAKQLCPALNPNLIIQMSCPVCGIPFGVMRSYFNATIKAGRSPPRFCSHTCHNKTRTKAWREKSPYAQNIKRIRKEQKL
jgi:hypothetical protein